VPRITQNLISGSQFARDNGVFVEFHSNYYVVKSEATDEVLLQGIVGLDDLYKFPNI